MQFLLNHLCYFSFYWSCGRRGLRCERVCTLRLDQALEEINLLVKAFFDGGRDGFSFFHDGLLLRREETSPRTSRRNSVIVCAISSCSCQSPHSWPRFESFSNVARVVLPTEPGGIYCIGVPGNGMKVWLWIQTFELIRVSRSIKCWLKASSWAVSCGSPAMKST